MEVFGDFQNEVSVMLEIIKPLVNISLDIFESLSEEITKVKGDGSVVTICDFALQSLIMAGLRHHLPNDKVLGEEDFTHLSDDFLALVKKILPDDLDPVEVCKDAIKTITSDDHRVWVIDPIDGTQGFVQKGHFAIATALLVDLQLKCSVTAWPRHSPEFTGLPINGPAIFVAVEGRGAWAFDMDNNMFAVKAPEHPKRVICYSDATGGMKKRIRDMVDILGMEDGIAMISMTKGFIVASGMANVYVKYHANHEENAWDVAPFELFVRESGGFATTPDGKQITYTGNGTVANSGNGLVFTSGTLEHHQQVCAVFHQLSSKEK